MPECLRSDDIADDGVLGSGALDDLLVGEQRLRNAAHLDDGLLVLSERVCEDGARVAEHPYVVPNHLRDSDLLFVAEDSILGVGSPAGNERDVVGKFGAENLTDLHRVFTEEEMAPKV